MEMKNDREFGDSLKKNKWRWGIMGWQGVGLRYKQTPLVMINAVSEN